MEWIAIALLAIALLATSACYESTGELPPTI